MSEPIKVGDYVSCPACKGFVKYIPDDGGLILVRKADSLNDYWANPKDIVKEK